jgi:toxin ParE1/3/4
VIVNVFVQPAARADILREYSRYVELGVPDVAERFLTSVRGSIDAITVLPHAGAPRSFDNPQLRGLRAWPVKGFKELHIYYIVRSDIITIIRVLHSKRDVGAILERQSVDDPPSP